MGSERSQGQQNKNHKPAAAEKTAPQAKAYARPSFYSPSQSLAALSASSPGDIPLTPDNLLYLQRTIGNRAVVQLLQRKTKLSQPGDAYEQEADRVAEQVMRMPQPSSSQKTSSVNQTTGVEIQRSSPLPEGGIHRRVMDEEDRQKQPEENPPVEEESPVQMKSIAGAGYIQRQSMPEEEETIQAKNQAGQTPTLTPKVESQIHHLQSGGEPLSESVLARFEPPFGRDFSEVRVHTDSQAAASARAFNARAYTVGRNVVFAAGEYAPGTSDGDRLLAHELTHVVQQGAVPTQTTKPPGKQTDAAQGETSQASAVGNAAPNAAVSLALSSATTRVVQRDKGDQETAAPEETVDLNERLGEIFDQWRRDSEDADRGGNHRESAYALRVILLLQGVNANRFGSVEELEDFVVDIEETAEDEYETLAELNEAAIRVTKAFPEIWADKVYEALYLEGDINSLLADREDKLRKARDANERVPAYVLEHGLPVPFDEALRLNKFELELRHIGLQGNHIVKEVAIATRDYAATGWATSFYLLWNQIAENMAEMVRTGEHVVEYSDYVEFTGTQQSVLQTLAQRAGTVETEDVLKALDNEVVSLTHVAFLQAFVATLVALVPMMAYWSQGKQFFGEKLAEADATIQGESGEDRVLRALRWAHEAGYFGDAGEQILNNILAHGWQMAGMAIGFIIIQFIPYLNVAVDVVVLLYSGVDVVQTVFTLAELLKTVGSATTAVDLQRKSAQLASGLEGDSLRLLLDVLAITGAANGIRSAANRIRAASPALSEEEALRQALREGTGEEVAALRKAVAKRRIQQRLDPQNILGPLMDRGINPEVLEQALISGMSPRRLQQLVADVADIGQAESIIRFAGNNSSPVNALLNAGMPSRLLGEMANLDLGLRELSVCKILLANTGNAAKIEGFMAAFRSVGSSSVRELISVLTPKGVANVFEAGGEGAMQHVLEFMALERTGKVAGLIDWVEFSITRLNKRGTDLMNTLGELREAERIAQSVGPGEIVRVGGDARGRLDITVENAAGAISRNVDVTTAVSPFSNYSALTEGIKHVIRKVARAPVGSREATIRVRIKPTESLGAGRRKVFDQNGTWHIVERNGSIHARGDLLREAAANLPKIGDSGLLTHVNVTDFDGRLIGILENNGTSWGVIRP